MNTAIAAAVTGAAGVLEMQEDGSDLKPYNVGRASMDAVVAAMMGKVELKGPNDAIGGKRGFVAAMTDTPHLEQLTDFNSDTLAVEQVYRKAFSSENVADKAILDLTKKVEVKEDVNLTALNPQKRAAIVVVHTKISEYLQRVDYPKGEPENPLSKEELEDKFRNLAMYGGLTSEECDAVIDEIWKEDFSLEKIMNLISK